jgi:hypothetical protein
MRFFVPSKRKTKTGAPAPLDGMNEMVNAERNGRGYANSIKRRNGRHVERCCTRAMEECGWVQPRGRCVVTLTFVETSRRRDSDNIFGGAKFVLDGITEPKGKRTYGAGAIVDDSQRWIELRFGEILVDRERPGCWVEIEEIQDGVQEPTG